VSDDRVRRHTGDGHWDGVHVHAYKAEGTAPFRDVTRQVLFDDPAVGAVLRYFEVAPGGWTTLERHEHVHNVVIQRGSGRCLLGDSDGETVHDLAVGDLVTVPPWTWHQFRADGDEPLGFLCLVQIERDRPQLPDDETAARLGALLRHPVPASATLDDDGNADDHR
jgi:mannose-6-phosphate isomerase-like protein (cupin superfamily)